MDSPTISSTSKIFGAPYVKRSFPRRYWDDKWQWPVQLAEISKDELDKIPNDIKKEIYSYLRKTINWAE